MRVHSLLAAAVGAGILAAAVGAGSLASFPLHPITHVYRSSSRLPSRQAIHALLVCGVEVPNAKESPATRALPAEWPDRFPYSERDLTPLDAGGDELFYIVPRFVQHAAVEARNELEKFYSAVLPSGGDVLDLCSSWTSHYPSDYRARRCVVLGLNPLELLVNRWKTEFRVQNLNARPQLPYADASFDVVTLSLSVDYMTRPRELFAEINRVLRPGGLACMAFTNRCFQGKVVRRWLTPFSEAEHAKLVGAYFHYSSPRWASIEVADVSPEGWVGQQNPMIIVCGRKNEL